MRRAVGYTWGCYSMQVGWCAAASRLAAILRVFQSSQAVKPNVGIKVVGFERHEIAALFDVDGAPKRVSAIRHVNRGAVPVVFVGVERDVVFMKSVDEYCPAGAEAT